MAISVFLITYR